MVAGAREASPELDASGRSGTVDFVEVDLSEPDGAAHLVDAAAGHGRLDILVNNVGAATPRLDGFVAVTDEQWSTSYTLNLMAAVRTTRAALPMMLARGRGRHRLDQLGQRLPARPVGHRLQRRQGGTAQLLQVAVEGARPARDPRQHGQSRARSPPTCGWAPTGSRPPVARAGRAPTRPPSPPPRPGFRHRPLHPSGRGGQPGRLPDQRRRGQHHRRRRHHRRRPHHHHLNTVQAQRNCHARIVSTTLRHRTSARVTRREAARSRLHAVRRSRRRSVSAPRSSPARRAVRPVRTVCAPRRTVGPRSPTIVLVHGAFSGPSAWDTVSATLRKDGYTTTSAHCRCPAWSTTSPPSMPPSTRSPARRSWSRHSYGGFVVSNAAAGRTDVSALVFTAAFVPAPGETHHRPR